MESASLPSLREQISSLLEEQSLPLLRALLAESEPFELAQAVFEMGVTEQARLLTLMDPEHASSVLLEMNEPSLERLLGELGPVALSGYISHMEPDDAADVIGILDSEHALVIQDLLPEDFRRDVVNLLRYPEDSAGGIMDPDVVRVRDTQTVAEALHAIRRYVHRVEMDEFYSVFVVNRHERVVGVIPNWRMLLAAESDLVTDIMDPNVVVVRSEMDQEDIARLVRDHDLVTVPVVDDHNRLIGRVTVDDVVDVIQEEHHEDLGRITGTGRENVLELSLMQTLRLRTPWLMLALCGEFVSALVIEQHEPLLRSMTSLTFFIPVIMAMAGNAGIQSSSLVIRGLATGEVVLSHFWRRLGREIVIAVVIGSLINVIMITGGTLITGNLRIGISVGFATAAAIVIAAIFGTGMPMVLRRLNIDPAMATGPFITTMNDILGITVYLGIAYLILT